MRTWLKASRLSRRVNTLKVAAAALDRFLVSAHNYSLRDTTAVDMFIFLH
jgi:hypothetical protein